MVEMGYLVRYSQSLFNFVELQNLERLEISMKKKYSIVSLFAGCGGLDLGFTGDFEFLGKKYAKRNFEIAWANDIDEASCITFSNYFKKDIVCGDIREILAGKNEGPKIPEKVDIVLGGFPCQDFSHA
jgi:DNA (cytosine-5)-methyltransferase 1